MAFDGNTMSTAELRTFTGGVINETFNVSGSDVDMMAVDLVAGRMYEIDADAGNDSYLRIFDAFGNEVMANDDNFDSGEAAGANPYVQFMANYTGRYYIAFSPYYLRSYDPTTTTGRVSPGTPLPGATTTLTITDQGTEFLPDSNAINAITARGPSDITSFFTDTDRRHRAEWTEATSVGAADIEMSRLDLVKGDVLVIDITGRVPGSVDDLDAVLRVFNAAGALVGSANSTPTSQDSEAVITALTTGAYYIAVTGEGNATYSALDGSGAVAGDTGFYTAILHLNPTLIGSSIAQTLNGTFRDDYVVLMAGADSSNGNNGQDTLSGGDDADTLRGGNGQDILYGDEGNDQVFGDNDSDVLSGGYGDDLLDGGAKNDILCGGSGNDSLLGGTTNGNDTLHGEGGDDSLGGDAGNDVLFGGLGVDTLRGEDGADVLSGDSGSDLLVGGTGADTLDGGADNDTLNGEDGADALLGGAGGDSLAGGVSGDRLDGGAGDDTLEGGSGNDIFVFTATTNGIDTITDFSLAALAEFIDLSAIFDATGAVVTAGNLAQHVQVTPAGAGADSFLGIDANGATGGLSFTIIAQVNGVTFGALFDIGNFIL
jgi:Ca2+-binding RTX toxin-like protein